MKLKTKITLGYLTILVVLLAIGVYSVINVNKLDNAASNILKDNLYTLQLGKRMISSLDKMQAAKQQLLFSGVTPDVNTAIIRENVKVFEENLRKEQGNITEPGEGELVEDIAEGFQNYSALLLKGSLDESVYYIELLPRYRLLRDQLDQMLNMNMDAMIAKSDRAQQIAQQTRVYTLIALTVAMLLTLGFLLTVPAAITKPINRIVDSIQAASRKDFTQQLSTKGGDEFSRVAKVYNSMLKKLKEFEFSNLNELLMEKKRIELLVQNLDEGILLLDYNLLVIEANPVACDLLGLERKKLVGRQSQELENENDLYRELVKDIMIGRTADDHVLTLTVDGEEVFYRKSILEIVAYNELKEQRELSGYVISLRNVSDFKRLDQAKSNFLATVSHELKTPLASIGYSLKLLEDERVGETNAEQRNLIKTLKQETSRLQKMVGELIDVSRLESGKIQLNVQQANVADIIHYAEEVINLQLLPKQLRLEVLIENHLTDVLADVEKTTWVLVNLLSNAVRYSPEGDVITISTEDKEHEVLIKVRDNGPGIDLSNHDKIFHKFVQIPGKEQYKGGSGLGLSISQEFIQSQSGNIWVESELGGGSTFMISLPVYVAAQRWDSRRS
ncbi:ATP-binding protein [uncultured Pontibacter sp.]|uniref:sensor histidine kinase n=1 Tax=uncultured Pontibacter sp. TaxID=453356 RepID=UPI0026083154|nr:ATP-binding protein [uncultured Pontibacter sp.]